MPPAGHHARPREGESPRSGGSAEAPISWHPRPHPGALVCAAQTWAPPPRRENARARPRPHAAPPATPGAWLASPPSGTRHHTPGRTRRAARARRGVTPGGPRRCAHAAVRRSHWPPPGSSPWPRRPRPNRLRLREPSGELRYHSALHGPPGDAVFADDVADRPVGLADRAGEPLPQPFVSRARPGTCSLVS